MSGLIGIWSVWGESNELTDCVDFDPDPECVICVVYIYAGRSGEFCVNDRVFEYVLIILSHRLTRCMLLVGSAISCKLYSDGNVCCAR